jgi:hypothetical protein
VRKINLHTGNINTIAGIANQTSYSDGPALSAIISPTRTITLDKNGNIYIVESSHRVRLLNMSSGMVSTLTGQNIQPMDTQTDWQVLHLFLILIGNCLHC